MKNNKIKATKISKENGLPETEIEFMVIPDISGIRGTFSIQIRKENKIRYLNHELGMITDPRHAGVWRTNDQAQNFISDNLEELSYEK